MGNLEQRQSEWVKECVGLLEAPGDWEPNVGRARARFDTRQEDQLRRRAGVRRYLLAGAAAALVACVVVPAIPQTRVLAQQVASSGWDRAEQIWYWFTVVRRGPVLLPRYYAVAKTLQVQRLSGSDAPQPVSDAAEAAALAGFTPRLPESNALPGGPRWEVRGPSSFAGLSGDGAKIMLQIGAVITARWQNAGPWTEITLGQAQPPVVTAPAGFDMVAFADAGLRASGLRNQDVIRALSQVPMAVPALLVGYQTPYFVGVREVGLGDGSATLIEECGAEGSSPVIERITLLWSTSDRWYVLSGLPRDPAGLFSLGMAAAVSSEIDLAKSIR